MMALTKQGVLNEVDYNVNETANISAFREDGTSLTIPNKKVLFKDDGEYISLVGENYKVVKHDEIVGKVLDTFDSKDIGYEIGELNTKNNSLFLHLRHPETFSIDEHGNDIKMDTIITNSYDGTRSFGFELGAFRSICSNGMRIGQTEHKITQRHSSSLIPEIIIDNYVNHVNVFANEIVPFFKVCREHEITKKEGLKMLEQMDWLGKRLTKQAIEQWQEEKENKNIWGLLQVLTYLTTHVVKSYNRRRELELCSFNSIRKIEGV